MAETAHTQTAVRNCVQVVFGPKLSCTLSSCTASRRPNYIARDLVRIGHVQDDAPGCHPIHGNKAGKAVFGARVQRRGSATGEEPLGMAIKWATGTRCLELLWKEAGFYENDLKHLQGVAVPMFYGFYTGSVSGVDVGCLLLEWCAGQPNPDLWERNRQKLLAAALVHAARIAHGGLFELDDNYVVSTKDNTIRIINFARAGVHECPGGTPLLLHPPGSEEQPKVCFELAVLEESLGPDSGKDGYRIRAANGLPHTGFSAPWV